MSASLNEKTRVQYKKVSDQFFAFQQRHYPNMMTLPINTGVAIQFLTNMHLTGQSSSTILSTVSALNFINKISGGEDLYKCFCLSRLVKGIRAVNPSKDQRLLITPDILKKTMFSNPNFLHRPRPLYPFKSYDAFGLPCLPTNWRNDLPKQ